MPTRLIPLTILLACATALCAADEKPAAQPDLVAIRKLVEQLGSSEFATREKATQELSKLDEVPEALQEATKSSDAEVRRRAQLAIDAITPRAEAKALKEMGVEWTLTHEFKSNDPHNPLVVGDKVIVGTDRGQLLAFRCKDGSSVWVHEHGQRIYYKPRSDGQRIFFSSAAGVSAVKVEDGTEVWRFASAVCDGPTLVLPKLGLVFVGGNDGTLYALDTKTGKQMWASDFVADAPPDRPNFPGRQARLPNAAARPAALASDGESIFLSVADQSRMVAFRASDGKRLWSFQANGWVFSSGAETEKYVFFGSQDDAFYCLDKRTGAKVWSYQTKGRIESGGVLDDKFVYFGSCDGSVYCLNQSDGKLQWRFATDPTDDGRNSPIYSVPLLSRGSVYFAAGEGQAYAVDQQTGKLKWKIRPSKGSEMYCTPVTDGAFVFVVTRSSGQDKGEPSLVALRLK